MADGDRTVTLALPCDNVQENPETRYRIGPEQVFAASKLARSRGEDIVGFYHSHPDHPPHYSETDLLEGYWFDCSYVITSVQRGHATMTESFVLQGSEDKKKIEEEEMEIMGQRPLHPPLS